MVGASATRVERGLADLAPGQVFAFGAPRIGAGLPDARNVIRVSALTYMEMQGQLAATVCALAPGQHFGCVLRRGRNHIPHRQEPSAEDSFERRETAGRLLLRKRDKRFVQVEV